MVVREQVINICLVINLCIYNFLSYFYFPPQIKRYQTRRLALFISLQSKTLIENSVSRIVQFDNIFQKLKYYNEDVWRMTLLFL